MGRLTDLCGFPDFKERFKQALPNHVFCAPVKANADRVFNS